jgi:hypothetical protein
MEREAVVKLWIWMTKPRTNDECRLFWFGAIIGVIGGMLIGQILK